MHEILCSSVLESSKTECFPDQEQVSSTGLVWGDEIQSLPYCRHTDMYNDFLPAAGMHSAALCDKYAIEHQVTDEFKGGTNIRSIGVGFPYTSRRNVTRKFQAATQTLEKRSFLVYGHARLLTLVSGVFAEARRGC